MPSFTESLEQQTATADVLRAIASSPTQLQDVLNTVVGTAARLCGADKADVQVPDGDVLRIVASVFATDEAARHYADRQAAVNAAGLPQVPIRLVPERISGRAALERRTIYVPNLADMTEFPDSRIVFERFGVLSQVTAPLIRGDELIGIFTLHALRTDAFSPSQIAQLETFADQAVIAIENARLFGDLRESLEQQTATADVLRVIASSPTDLQRVLQAIVESATRLCEADNTAFFRVEGDEFVRMANLRPGAGSPPVGLRIPLVRGSWVGRAVLDKRTIRHDDVEEIVDREYPVTARTYRERLAQEGDLAYRVRSLLVIPLLREGDAIGALVVSRGEVRPFTEQQIALLETFADQAVIAIENARLFEELEQRNAELKRQSLEQQTATAEILHVIASSPTNAEPVLDAILQSALRLSTSSASILMLRDGDTLRAVASTIGSVPVGTVRSLSERRPTTRALLERCTIHLPRFGTIRHAGRVSGSSDGSASGDTHRSAHAR